MNIKMKEKEHYIMCWSLLSYTFNKYPDIAKKVWDDFINNEIPIKQLDDKM